VDELDSTLSTFTASDGDNLAVQAWPTPRGVVRRGVVVLVHGLGGHAGRYDALARRLTAWGFAVQGYDQVGHGESGGPRGRLPSSLRLIEDLGDIVESARRRMRPDERLIVLGHGLGAVVAGCLVMLRDIRVDGLVLSAPAFRPVVTRWQRWIHAALQWLAPDLRIRSGIAPEAISRDPEVVDAYRCDPLVHDRTSVRLGGFMAMSGPRVLARAPHWRWPTLVLWGGRDCVVDPAAIREFTEAAPRPLVAAHCFPDMFHEVFNDIDPEPANDALRSWLDARFPPRPPGRSEPARTGTAAVPTTTTTTPVLKTASSAAASPAA
jgi:alpha-beta hydrolase superfamily lysophospholipase